MTRDNDRTGVPRPRGFLHGHGSGGPGPLLRPRRLHAASPAGHGGLGRVRVQTGVTGGGGGEWEGGERLGGVSTAETAGNLGPDHTLVTPP